MSLVFGDLLRLLTEITQMRRVFWTTKYSSHIIRCIIKSKAEVEASDIMIQVHS